MQRYATFARAPDHGGRAHVPDPASCRQVEALAGYGVPEADIAGVVEIDAKTLRKHYRRELDTGQFVTPAACGDHFAPSTSTPADRG